MVSKEPQAPSKIPMCEAPILPAPLIHPSAWKWNSAKFECRIVHKTPSERRENGVLGHLRGVGELHVVVVHKDPRM